jgi:NAD(P)-dependent dehydrogenase (short-subunit alcohol dehydrogenase family)
MQIDLKDNVILVTGAGRGIGRSIARRLAEAGATVAVHYGRSSEKAEALAAEIGRGARPFQADLSDAEASHALVKAVVDTYGRLDTVVNNAGIAEAVDPRADLESFVDVWDRTLDVNARAAAITSRAAIGHWLETGRSGRVIFIASRAAFRGDTPDYMAYAASKGAMIPLARTIARGYGKEGIKAFTIAPGFVRTDMAQDAIDRYGEGFVVDDLALDRLTEPDDISPFVVLLASGASDHATGCTIDINAASYVH